VTTCRLGFDTHLIPIREDLDSPLGLDHRFFLLGRFMLQDPQRREVVFHLLRWPAPIWMTRYSAQFPVRGR
jgi:hypothetical protein